MLSILFFAPSVLGWLGMSPTGEPTDAPTLMVATELTGEDGAPEGYMLIGEGLCTVTDLENRGVVIQQFRKTGECATLCNEHQWCHHFTVNEEMSEAGGCVLWKSEKLDNDCACGETGFYEEPNYFSYKKEYRWIENFKLSGTFERQDFGERVAMSASGEVFAVVRPNVATKGDDVGEVLVYKKGEAGWEPMGDTIRSPDEGDSYFGSGQLCLSPDGQSLAVGSKNAKNGGTSMAGKVEVFRWVTDKWVRLAPAIRGSFRFDYFGENVAMSDDGFTIAVASTKYAGNSGGVKIYQYGGGMFRFKKEINGPSFRESLGEEVAMDGSGSRIAVSSVKAPDMKWIGRVEIYDLQGDDWVKTKTIDGDFASDYFGKALAMSGDGKTLAIGANKGDTQFQADAGTVSVYKEKDGSWSLVQTLEGDAPNGQFGQSVAMSYDGKSLIVGNPEYKMQGRYIVYKFDEDDMMKPFKRMGSPFGTTKNGAYFGEERPAMSAEGTTIIIGEPSDDKVFYDGGRASIYDWTKQEITDVSACTTSEDSCPECEACPTPAPAPECPTPAPAPECPTPAPAPDCSSQETEVLNLKDQVNNLETDKSNLQTEVNNLNTDKTNLQTEVNNLTTDKTNLETDKSNLQDDVNQCNLDKGNLETDKTNLQTEVNNLTTDKTNLETDKSNLETEVNNLTTDKTNLQTEVNNLTTDKNNLQSQVDTLDEENKEMKAYLECMPPSIYNKDTKICTPGLEFTCVYVDYGTLYARNAIPNGLMKVTKTSAQECHDWCKANTEADLFTYKTANKACHCKASDLGFRFFSKGGRTSGAIMNTFSSSACDPPKINAYFTDKL